MSGNINRTNAGRYFEPMLVSTEEEDKMSVVISIDNGREVYFIGRIREYDNGTMWLKAKNGATVDITDRGRKQLRDPNPMDRLLYL